MKRTLKFSKPKKVKKLNRKTEKRKARDAFKLFIRLRDCEGKKGADCYTCKKWFEFAELDAGHFIQGSHESTYFIEENCHAQCTYCNRYLHGNLVKYTLHMIADYGEEFVRELQYTDRTPKQMKAQDFHDIYEKYKKLNGELGG